MMDDEEIRQRITAGVREYLDDRFVGGSYPVAHGQLEAEPITDQSIEDDVTGIVESVIDDLRASCCSHPAGQHRYGGVGECNACPCRKYREAVIR